MKAEIVSPPVCPSPHRYVRLAPSIERHTTQPTYRSLNRCELACILQLPIPWFEEGCGQDMATPASTAGGASPALQGSISQFAMTLREAAVEAEVRDGRPSVA